MNWLTRLFGKKPAASAAAPAAARRTTSPPILTQEDLRSLVERCGFGEAEAEIVALAEPVFHIIAGPPARDAPLGATRLGGAPDLPAGAEWPVGRFGTAMFLGQFDLADVRVRTGSDLLPANGLLSLFIVEIGSAADPVKLLSLLTPAETPLERLAPPADMEPFRLLKPVSIAAFQPGISLSQSDLYRLHLEERFPDGDFLTFELALCERPNDAIGEWLGRGFDGHGRDQREVAHGRRIGRPDLERYSFIGGWAEWQDLKSQGSRLVNGTVYRPWRDENDDDVRWLLDNRAAFDAGVEALRLLVRINSNRPMELWINDADPIYVFVDAARLAEGDLSELHGTVTQG